jgi:FkbM family methyltransferase
MKKFRYWLKRVLYWIVVPILSGPLKGYRFGLFTGSRFIVGSYGGREVDVLTDLARPDDVVFDIGAHVGYMTLLASKSVGDNGQVFAFEPLPLNLVYLRNHVKINRLANTRVLPCAVSRTAGWLSFDFGKGTGRGNLKANGASRALKVKVVGLDEMVRGGELPPPNLIKMDIEGAEVEALKGAAWIFTSARPKLLLSTHGAAIKAECEALLTGWDYELSAMMAGAILAIPR